MCLEREGENEDVNYNSSGKRKMDIRDMIVITKSVRRSSMRVRSTAASDVYRRQVRILRKVL